MKPTIILIGVCVALTLAICTTAQAGDKLNIYNWSGYIAPELVQKFQKETGIDITTDNYDSNDTLLAKLKQGGSGYDIAITTNMFVPIMIAEGLIEKINAAEIPGYDNIIETLKSPEWDPGNQYSVPYMWGTTSFAVNTEKYGGDIDSFKVLFEPPTSLQGNINMFDIASDVIDMASIYLGIPFCSEDPKEMKQVLDLLKAQKPYVKTYSAKAGAIREALVAGELDMSVLYNGSSMRTREMKSTIRYAYPKEGVLAWVDNIVVPKGAKNPENAKKFISFFLKPENVALNTNFLRYQNGVKATEKFINAGLADAPEMNIPGDRKLFFGKTCGEKAIKLRDRIWTNLLR